MQNFYTQLFAQKKNGGSQMAALAKITHLSNDELRSIAVDLIWNIWN